MTDRPVVWGGRPYHSGQKSIRGKKRMPNESFNLYKLIVLYILNKVKTPLPQRIIFDFVTSRGYTNYFTILSAFGDLLQAELILESTTYHISYYSLTRAGRETLESFGSSLSFEIRHEIDDYLKEKNMRLLKRVPSSATITVQRTAPTSLPAPCAKETMYCFISNWM